MQINLDSITGDVEQTKTMPYHQRAGMFLWYSKHTDKREKER